MADSHSWLIHELFAPVLALVDTLSLAANEGEAASHFNCDESGHWRTVRKTLEKIENSSENRLAGHLAAAVRTIAAIREGTRTQCNTYPDVAIYLFHRRDALRQAAQDGWTAAKQGGIIPEDPFPVKPTAMAETPKKSKRSTERGEGHAKLIAALTKHHKYAEGGCLNMAPIGNNELARLAGVSASTASQFFNKEFLGHTKYRAICDNKASLVWAIKLLNQEFSPHHLFSAKPPGEDDE